ncbi:MAG: methionine synthase, partial [Candidatus Frackibacter sp. T328-2]
LEEEGLRDSVKIIVGGAPVTPDFAEEIGADGWSADAASAKDKALELIG